MCKYTEMCFLAYFLKKIILEEFRYFFTGNKRLLLKMYKIYLSARCSE